MTTTPEEKDYIAQVCAEDNAKRSPKPLRRAGDCPVPPAGDVEVQRFWAEDARNIRCVRAEDFDTQVARLQAEVTRLALKADSLEFAKWSCQENQRAIQATGHETIDDLAAERDALKADLATARKQAYDAGFDTGFANGKEQGTRNAESELTKAREAARANHEWHQKYDEHGGYDDSSLCQMNMDVLLNQSAPAAKGEQP